MPTHTERYGPVLADDYAPIRRRVSTIESAPAAKTACIDANGWRAVEIVCTGDTGVIYSVTVGRWITVSGNGVTLDTFVAEYTISGITGSRILRSIGDGFVGFYVSAATGLTALLGVQFVVRRTNLDLGMAE